MTRICDSNDPQSCSCSTGRQPHPQRCNTGCMKFQKSECPLFHEEKLPAYDRVIILCGCASHSTAPAPEGEKCYIITETMLNQWRAGCLDISDPHMDTDVCRNCQFRGKDVRAKCCDFDDNAMEQIFRSRPYTRRCCLCDICDQTVEQCIGREKRAEQCKTCKHEGTRACMSHGYQSTGGT